MFKYKAYTASSVINAVEANKNLSTWSIHLGCLLRSKHPFKQIDIHECYGGNAQKCDEKRAHTHKCRRILYVDYMDNDKQRLVVLPFDFTISAANPDGFIGVDNPMLAILISGNHINVDRLESVEVDFDFAP